MGILLDDRGDFVIDQILDTVLIFALGSILVGFFHTMINFPKTFLVAFASFMTVIIALLMLFMNQLCNDDAEKHKIKKDVLNFAGIYTICLNLLIIFVVANRLI